MLEDIGALILPRFFLATTQAGVTSMSWVIDGARERKLAPGAVQIETAHAEWIYRFSNGYRVALKGMLSVTYEASIIRPASAVGPGPTLATVNPEEVKLLITAFDMNVSEYEKYIKLDSISGERTREDVTMYPYRVPGAPEPPSGSTQAIAEEADRRRRSGEEPRIQITRATMPGEPINAFGIPQATMRCLEVSVAFMCVMTWAEIGCQLAESVGAMSDLMEYADVNRLGPLGTVQFHSSLEKFGTPTDEKIPLSPIPLTGTHSDLQLPSKNSARTCAETGSRSCQTGSRRLSTSLGSRTTYVTI